VRVFPSEAALFLAVPIVWFAVDTWQKHRRMPSLTELRAAQRPALRALAGAAGCVAATLILTLALFGSGDNWGAWHHKAEIHETAPVRTTWVCATSWLSVPNSQPAVSRKDKPLTFGSNGNACSVRPLPPVSHCNYLLVLLATAWL